MRKITVLAMVTLDGVIQAPGGPQEDPSGDFQYGGWSAPYGDETSGTAVKKELAQPVDYLLGRKTFDIWEDFWPAHAHIWPGINQGTKYVLSNSRKKSDWEHTTFIEGLADIKTIKNSAGNNIQVWGSSELVHLLFEHDLVDELRLKIYPLVLGNGKKLFNKDAMPAGFTLTESFTTPKGIIIANYNRAGAVQIGTIGA